MKTTNSSCETLPAPKDMSSTQVALQLGSLGSELVLPAIVGAILSAQLHWGKSPILIGLALGIFGSTAHLLLLLKISK